MDRSIKKPDQSSNSTGAPAGISKMNYLGGLQLSLVRRLRISVNKEGNGTVPRMCPKCVHSSPFESHTRGIVIDLLVGRADLELPCN